MTELARKRRWARFVDPRSQKAVIVPIDHGLTMGPLPGLQRIDEVLRWLDPQWLTGIVAHKGLAHRLGPVAGCGLMMHLNGSINRSDCPDLKVAVTSVEAAVRAGADAVSMQLNFQANTAAHNLQLMGRVVDEAHAMGMPVLAMVYDKTQQASLDVQTSIDSLRHFMRVAIELGVDALKVTAPSCPQRTAELLDDLPSHTPVVFAGGALGDEAAMERLAQTVMCTGAAGICVGRNVFQRSDPGASLRRLMEVFRRQGTTPAVLRQAMRHAPGELQSEPWA